MDADPDVAGAISALQAALRDRQSPRLDRTTAASIAAHRGGEQHAAVVLSPPSGRRRHDARSFAILVTDPWAPGARFATQTSPFRSIAVRLGLFAWLVVKNATPPSVRPKPSIGTTL